MQSFNDEFYIKNRQWFTQICEYENSMNVKNTNLFKQNKMIHPLLEQSRKIAKKNTWIFTEILMLFKVAREQWDEGEW